MNKITGDAKWEENAETIINRLRDFSHLNGDKEKFERIQWMIDNFDEDGKPKQRRRDAEKQFEDEKDKEVKRKARFAEYQELTNEKDELQRRRGEIIDAEHMVRAASNYNEETKELEEQMEILWNERKQPSRFELHDKLREEASQKPASPSNNP